MLLPQKADNQILPNESSRLLAALVVNHSFPCPGDFLLFLFFVVCDSEESTTWSLPLKTFMSWTSLTPNAWGAQASTSDYCSLSFLTVSICLEAKMAEVGDFSKLAHLPSDSGSQKFRLSRFSPTNQLMQCQVS